MPPFVVAYITLLVPNAADNAITIRPEPCALKWGQTALDIQTAPSRCVSIIFLVSPDVISSNSA